jgi:hypothetical protein
LWKIVPCTFGNVQKYGTARKATGDNIKRRMLFAFWITREEYRHTLMIFSTYCFSTATTVTRTRLNVKLSSHLRTMSADSPPRDRIHFTVPTATWCVQSNKPCSFQTFTVFWM